MRAISTVLALALVAVACAPEDAPLASAPRDAARDGLFRDFFDGKFDEAGHPLGAQVWRAEAVCDAGQCAIPSGAIGRGRFVVNVRALALEPLPADAAVLELRVTGADGGELAHTVIDGARFGEAHVYQNASLSFTHATDGAVHIEVRSDGAPVELDYIELFRARRGLAISPTSGLLPADAAIQIEILDAPSDWQLALACGERDLTEALAAALDAGEATRQDTEFRSLVTLPATLLAPCPRPTRLTAKVVAGWTRASARVTYLDEPVACAFDDSPRMRVLLTGFEPFPADAWHGNSAEQAVLGYDASGHPDVQVMRMVLPVEWQTAAAWVSDAIERCEPEVVIGFGQGRSAVDIETTAYNLMDTSAVSGGVPDNRGLVHGGTPIDVDGPAEQFTRLPVETILEDLAARGVTAHESDDPGRYICNNVFYGIMSALDDRRAVGGFVHLPYMSRFDADDRALLQQTVDAVVSAASNRVETR